MIAVELAESDREFGRFSALVDEYEASLPPDLRHRQWCDERTHLAQAYGAPNAAFVATIDDAPIGCVAFVRHDASCIIVKKLYVSPAVRGLGAARTLMDALACEARKRGYTQTLLDTDPVRLRAAYQLYRSLGYVECAPFASVDYQGAAFMQRSL